MAILKLTAFAGENPKIIPRLLPSNASQLALNTRLTDGGLTPIRKSRFVTQITPEPETQQRTIYRHLGQWYSWGNQVYAFPGPVATDRLYIMGDGAPKMLVGETVYPLAVPFPATALTATISGTSTDDLGSTRLYAYTWVTDFGEESEPSPVSSDIYWKPGQTVTLSGFASVPSGRNITKQRIYRSQTSLTGTLLYLIEERAASAADYVDTVSIDAFQEPLPSAGWNPPIDELTGLVSLPAGMMAAFSGKDLYFCEPYRPHAWPESYVLTVDYNIVGLGAFGNTLVVATEGNPYIVTGQTPETMYMEKLELNLPCVNGRSIVDLGYSVAYASYDGLVLVSQGGARVVTEAIFSREGWLKQNPFAMTAGQYDGRYFCTYQYSEGEAEYKGTLIMDMTGEQPFVIRSTKFPDAMHYDLQTGSLFMLNGSAISEWDAVGQPNELQSWRSKLFNVASPTSFGAILIEADEGLTDEQIEGLQEIIDEVTAQNEAILAADDLMGELNADQLNERCINGDALQDVPGLSQFYAVNVFADRELIAVIGAVNQMERLPAGIKARQWEVEIVSDAPIVQVTLAGTGQELRQVE